jgi:hypothetical protein
VLLADDVAADREVDAVAPEALAALEVGAATEDVGALVAAAVGAPFRPAQPAASRAASRIDDRRAALTGPRFTSRRGRAMTAALTRADRPAWRPGRVGRERR